MPRLEQLLSKNNLLLFYLMSKNNDVTSNAITFIVMFIVIFLITIWK